MSDPDGSEPAATNPPRGRWGRGRVVVWLVVVGVLGGVSGWSIRTLASPAAGVPESARYTVVAARPGSVGQDIRLNVRAEWPPGLKVLAGTSGVITEVLVADGDVVSSGDRILSVELKPVVVADGSIPAFRTLKSGDSGPDVTQLQKMLQKLGYSTGDKEGLFGTKTLEGVRQWQTSLGTPATGMVGRGSLVFVPQLPARVLLADQTKVGVTLGEGQPVLSILPKQPSFTMHLAEGQTSLVAQDQAVVLESAQGKWLARTGPIVLSMDTGDYYTILRPENGSQSICGTACETLPVGTPSLVPSRVQIVPEVKGIVIPASAVITTADDQKAVVLPTGELRGVRVVAGAFGTVVVEGLSAGEQVRAPGLLDSAKTGSP